MISIKKYKNIWISLLLYIVAVTYYMCLIYVPNISPNIVYYPTAILLLVGILFGQISNKKKESTWGGNLLIIIYILTLLYPSFAVYLAYILDSLINGR